jgi:hypothetical protein
MGSGGAIRLITGVALVIAALALLGLTLPHDGSRAGLDALPELLDGPLNPSA